jgi:hypothetical protein
VAGESVMGTRAVTTVKDFSDQRERAADHRGEQDLDIADNEAPTFDSALHGDSRIRVDGVAEQRFGVADVDDQAGEVGLMIADVKSERLSVITASRSSSLDWK